MPLFRIGQGKTHRIGYTRDADAEFARSKNATPDGLVMKTWDLNTGEAMLAYNLIRSRVPKVAGRDGWYLGTPAELDRVIESAVADVKPDRIEKLTQFEPGDYAQTMIHLRIHVFETTQEMMATLVGRTPPVVSKWESGTNKPGIPELMRLRSYALALNLPWQDSFLLGSHAA